MAQLVTRIDAGLERMIDELIVDGVVESRSDAVRRGLAMLIDRHRRKKVADQIIAGYAAQPQANEDAWGDAATRRMIAEEPW